MTELNKNPHDLEKVFFKDFFNFGSFRYELFVVVMRDKFQSSQTTLEKKLIFIEINSFLNRTLEDYGAYLFGLQRAIDKEVMLIETLQTYPTKEAQIENFIKDKDDQEIISQFGLGLIYQENFNLDQDEIEKYLKSFVLNLKTFAEVQNEHKKLYNKDKHGNIVLSNAKILNPLSTDPRDSIAILARDEMKPNVMPYSEEQFFIMCDNILTLKHQIIEIIYAYLAKYNPPVAKELKVPKIKS